MKKIVVFQIVSFIAIVLLLAYMGDYVSNHICNLTKEEVINVIRVDTFQNGTTLVLGEFSSGKEELFEVVEELKTQLVPGKTFNVKIEFFNLEKKRKIISAYRKIE